ncbi:MAG: hypothetical protein WCL21_02030 [Mariniphaga sp.]
MNEKEIKQTPEGNFCLDKWFLDFVGENGEAMIFYAATLTWHGWSSSYTSWLHYDGSSGVHLKSRFRSIQFPQIKDNLITWNDPKSGMSGTWESMAEMIQSRIFDSEEGFLEWKCFQPASKVQLKINDSVLDGRGYAEQLILTIPPWKIPMNELRWGHFGSAENNMVWIELREKKIQRWFWLNGEKIENCTIEDDHIALPGKGLILNLDRGVLLESEKKIFSIATKIVRFIPGFKRVMPLNFLMADEIKWLSKGQLRTNQNIHSTGTAIHEFVNFKAFKP